MVDHIMMNKMSVTSEDKKKIFYKYNNIRI